MKPTGINSSWRKSQESTYHPPQHRWAPGGRFRSIEEKWQIDHGSWRRQIAVPEASISTAPTPLGERNVKQVKRSTLKSTHTIQDSNLNVELIPYNKSIRDALSLTGAIQAFSQIKKDGYKPNIISYNSLIRAYINDDNLDGANLIYQEMVDEGVDPDVFTFTNLIRGCGGKNPQLTRASSFFQMMEEKGILPNITTFNTYLNVCADAEDITSAQKVLELMNKYEQTWDEVTIGTLIKVYANAEDSEGAMDVFQDMKQKYKPNEVIYTTLIRVNMRVGDTSKAFNLFSEMKEKNIRIPTRTYETVIKGCVKTKNLEHAYRFYEEMKTGWNNPDIIFYTKIIHDFINYGRVDLALKVFNDVERPTYEIIVRLINACVEIGQTEVAKGIFEKHFPFKISHEEGIPCLDCHGLSYSVALIQMLVFIDKNPHAYFQLVTGAGMHSKDRPLFAMQDFLKNNLPDGWKASISHFSRSGCLNVYPVTP